MIVRTGQNDYTRYIRPAAQAWLEGDTRLYDPDAAGFYFPPWSLLLILPTLLVGPAVGQAIINALTMIGIALALGQFGRGLPRWLWALAATPFFVFVLIVTGNFDGIVLLGLGISWWAASRHRPWAISAGLWLASLKPINALPLIPFVVLMTWRWTRKEKLAGVSFLFVSALISFPLSGPEWPLRYVRFSLASPPAEYLTVNLWKVGERFGIVGPLLMALATMIIGATVVAIVRLRRPIEAFALTMAAWMMLTPYAHDIHYAVLIPSFLTVARHSRPAAVVAYLVSYTPLLRIPYGFEANFLDLAFPASLWLAAIGLFSRGVAAPDEPFDAA